MLRTLTDEVNQEGSQGKTLSRFWGSSLRDGLCA